MAVADKFTSAALHDLAEADEEVPKIILDIAFELFVMIEKAFTGGVIHF